MAKTIYNLVKKRRASLEIQPYTAPNWVTDQGVARKLRLISKNGLPSLMYAKRLTFTVDRQLFDNELDAMQTMLCQFPKFIRNLKSLYKSEFGRECPEYVMWIEFHSDGWPHFHMDWLRRGSLPLNWIRFDGFLSRLWKLGNVHIKTINRHQDHYAFKYAFKPEGKHDSDFVSYALPRWFLDAKWTELVPVIDSDGKAAKHSDGSPLLCEKTKTFRRLRMWRPSKNFYRDAPEYKKKEPKPQNTGEFPITVRTQFDDYENKAVVVARDGDGKYIKSFVIQFSEEYGKVYHDSLINALCGESFPNKYGIIVDDSFILNKLDKNKQIEINKLWQLQEVTQQLTPQQLWNKQPLDKQPLLAPF